MKNAKLLWHQRSALTTLDFLLIDLRETGDDRWSRPENVWSATARSSRSDLRVDDAGLAPITSGIVSFWAAPSLPAVAS